MKGLHCIAHDCSRPGFFKFSFLDVMHFDLWDLMFNDTFVVCSSVFTRSLGTAIGGSAWAQCASLAVARQEVEMCHASLPPIVRYRDNFLVPVLHSALHHMSPMQFIEEVSSQLHTGIGMQVTVEVVTQRLPFLEALVFVTSESTIEPSVKPPVFTQNRGDCHPPSHRRLLDACSPNAHEMLQSFVPNQVAKCIHYAFGQEVIYLNVVSHS